MCPKVKGPLLDASLVVTTGQICRAVSEPSGLKPIDVGAVHGC